MESGNILHGKLLVYTFLGLIVRMIVDIGDKKINVDVLEKNFSRMNVSNGDKVDLYLPPEGFITFLKE